MATTSRKSASQTDACARLFKKYVNPHDLSWSAYEPPRPTSLGPQTFEQYPLDELVDCIDWTPFFKTWELRGTFPAILDDATVGEHARALHKDASCQESPRAAFCDVLNASD